MDLPTVEALMAEWESTPPAAVTLKRIEGMIGAWLGAKPRQTAPKKQETDKAADEATMNMLLQALPVQKAERIITPEEYRSGDWQRKSKSH